MRPQKYKIKMGAQESELTIERTGLFTKSEIFLDGKKLADLASGKELKSGQEFSLSDGSKLKFQMVATPFPEFQISHNGIPVKGSSADEKTRIRTAYNLMAVLCGLNFFIGALTIFTRAQVLVSIGFGFYNLIVGTIFLICVLAGRRKQSFWPLAIGLAVFLLESVMMFYTTIRMGHPLNPGPIFVRIILIIPWFKGAKASYLAKKEAKRFCRWCSIFESDFDGGAGRGG